MILCQNTANNQVYHIQYLLFSFHKRQFGARIANSGMPDAKASRYKSFFQGAYSLACQTNIWASIRGNKNLKIYASMIIIESLGLGDYFSIDLII